MGKTGTKKKPNRLNTSNDSASDKGLPSCSVCHHLHTTGPCSLRPSRSSGHIFLSIHASNKIAKIFTCGRIWLLKLCHYHKILGELADLTTNCISAVAPTHTLTCSAQMFNLAVQKENLPAHSDGARDTNVLPSLPTWIFPQVTNEQRPDSQGALTPGTDPVFVGPEACTIWRPSKEKNKAQKQIFKRCPCK